MIMEVASQGLKLHRTQGFTFEIGIFTNLEPDHIGPNEHADFEEYLACKGLLFQQCWLGIVNKDDAHADAVVKGHTCQLETYGLDKHADIYADHIELVNKPGELGIRFQVKERGIGNRIPGKRKNGFSGGGARSRQIQRLQCPGGHCGMQTFQGGKRPDPKGPSRGPCQGKNRDGSRIRSVYPVD